MESNTNESDGNKHSEKPNKSDNEETEEKTLFIDEKVIRMMKLMGYKSGSGLGKNEQGITEPIDLKHQSNTQGLGAQQTEQTQDAEVVWHCDEEEINVEEQVEWIESSDDFPFTYASLIEWMKESVPLTEIDEQCEFCDREVLRKLMKAKGIFEEYNLQDLYDARLRANAFETIGSVFFLNRAALKIANIDAATNFMFTNLEQNIHHKDCPAPYYFADVCAGPGGFTEYVLWRKEWFFKGFGFTLRDGFHDFKLHKSICISRENFKAFYGPFRDGNVCRPENIVGFKNDILTHTRGDGVHFMMSDGGFSVEGHENIQEVLSKDIYLCQCLVCLEIVRTHGHFVTKFFDVFTPFSVGLIYLMYKCFEKVCILKPNSSRPANSERYLICYGLKNENCVVVIKQYLRVVAQRLWEIKMNPSIDVNEIVPLKVIKNDEKFYSYIHYMNNKLARKQIISLRKMEVFCRNPNLVETRQEDLRKKCLEYWKIPNKNRHTYNNLSVDELWATVDKKDILSFQPEEYYGEHHERYALRNLNECYYAPLETNKITGLKFFAAASMLKVYRLDSNRWEKLSTLRLYRGTVLYGELVREYTLGPPNGSAIRHLPILHVIDAVRLGNLDISNFDFNTRIKLINIYCDAVRQESQEFHGIRAKVYHTLEHIIHRNDNFHQGRMRCFANLPDMTLFKSYEGIEFFYADAIIVLKNDNKDESDDVRLFLKMDGER